MPDKGELHALAIHRMPEGGYLVTDTPLQLVGYEGHGRVAQFYYACTDIRDALQFVRDSIEPVSPTQKGTV